MKITLTTIDNEHSLSFDGETTVSQKLFGSAKTTTLGGKTKKRWIGYKNTINVKVNKLSDVEYQELIAMWSNSLSEIILNTETGATYIGIIGDTQLKFVQKYTADGDSFRSGSLTIEE